MKKIFVLILLATLAGCGAKKAGDPSKAIAGIPISEFKDGELSEDSPTYWYIPAPDEWTDVQKQLHQLALSFIFETHELMGSSKARIVLQDKGGDEFVAWFVSVIQNGPTHPIDSEDSRDSYGWAKSFTEKAISQVASEKTCANLEPDPKFWGNKSPIEWTEEEKAEYEAFSKKVETCTDIMFKAPEASFYILEVPTVDGNRAITVVQQLKPDAKGEFALPVNHVRLHFLKQDSDWLFDGREIID